MSQGQRFRRPERRQEDVMTTTLVGYFDDYDEARQTEQDLINAGFRTDDVSIVFNSGGASEREGQPREGMWQRMKAAFGFASDEDRVTYEEAARHGGALLSVRVPDNELEDAATIIERHHPVDLDQRMEEWRGTGMSAGATTGSAGIAASSGESMGTDERSGGAGTIPIAEEQVQIGKRAILRGGVRVHTYVSETPVEESVMLREEHAVVGRRPADRPIEAGEAPFQERTIEVQEMGEEPVVAKQARVVEEVEVGKEATERRETVHETVRRTEVDVERDDDLKSRR
jgi:uncharacterized protein (TIGR02271 family)